MKVSPDYSDEIFPFPGAWALPSACGLKIRATGDKIFVIVTELYQENPGTSVTYAGVTLAAQICKAKRLNIDKINYIECNQNTNSKLSFYDDEYFEVDFNAPAEKKYRQLSREEIQTMLK